MSLPRFFYEDLALDEHSETGTELLLQGDAAHHAAVVLRLKTAERLVLSKGNGQDYLCEVLQATAAGLKLRFLEKQDNRTETLPAIVLWQGLPKASKLEEIIEKSVELGVHRVVPVKTSRSLIKLEDKAAAAKQARWQKISAAAAKQSGRGTIPAVALPCSFAAALDEVGQELAGGSAVAFIPWEEAQEPVLPAYLREVLERQPQLKVIHFFIGPEGGFSASEIEQAVAHGVTPLSLGRRILRTETAGPAVLAMLNVLLPDKML